MVVVVEVIVALRKVQSWLNICSYVTIDFMG